MRHVNRAPTPLAATLLLALAACAPARRGPETPVPGPGAPGAEERPASRLPPIPERDGPLQLDVVYPQEGGRIAVRDSTFVFGSTGTGKAQLTINGAPVEVQPNGTFLAFLPVPIDGVYRLRAQAGARSAELTRTVSVPPPEQRPVADSASIREGSLYPAGAWTVLPGERIEVGFRGSPGGTATLILPDGSRVPLIETGAAVEEQSAERNFGDVGKSTRREAWSSYRGSFTAQPLASSDTTLPWPSLAAGPRPAPGSATPSGAARPGRAPAPDTSGPALLGRGLGERTATLEFSAHGVTVRRPLPLNLAVLPAGDRRVAVVDVPPRPRSPGHARGNAVSHGTWIYFWPPRTRLTVTGERNGEYRVSLGPDRTAWVDEADVRLLADGTPPVHARVGTIRMRPYTDAVDIRIQLDERVPFQIEEGDHTFSITLFDAEGNTDYVRYGGADDFVRRGYWQQVQDGVYRLTLELAAWPWGYRRYWDANGDLVVRLRRPPAVEHGAPLRGLTIAVDAGHPPGGAISALRLTEAQANFGIAKQLQALLQEAGARVVMTRPDTLPLGLYERVETAEARDADLFVSIHNNAFPDGVNPFTNSGTSVYYFHEQSAALARELDAALVDALGLRDLGASRGSYAVIRNNTWMPAVLTESMFMMVPAQGSALGDVEVQRRIARAQLHAIETFVRERALPR